MQFYVNCYVDDIEFLPKTQFFESSHNHDVALEPQFNVVTIKHRPGKEVCNDTELVIRLPYEEGHIDIGHVNQEEHRVDSSTKRRKELVIGEHPLKYYHSGVTVDVIMCKNKIYVRRQFTVVRGMCTIKRCLKFSPIVISSMDRSSNVSHGT